MHFGGNLWDAGETDKMESEGGGTDTSDPGDPDLPGLDEVDELDEKEEEISTIEQYASYMFVMSNLLPGLVMGAAYNRIRSLEDASSDKDKDSDKKEEAIGGNGDECNVEKEHARLNNGKWVISVAEYSR